MALPNGSIDEKYEVLERLRQGGMGAVYKVRHRLLNELRVVKVIRPLAAGPEAGARFLGEARMASRLRHPNLAVLYDFAVDAEGDAHLVSEFIDGWTLRDLLRRQGPPPVALGLEIARQALEAIGFLHRHRIVHRDISPDNLMLSRDEDGLPRVKLIDFGIAKVLEEDGPGATASGVFLGKPRYASPEQFGPEPVDERSDLYSFGVVLYELLTGRCPIVGHDALSLMAAHLSRPPLAFEVSDPDGKLPEDLREILLGALEKRPEDRIPEAGEFLRALREVQARYPVAEEDLAAVFGLPVPAVAGAADPEAVDPEAVDWEETDSEASNSLYLRPVGAAGPGIGDSSPVDEITWGGARRPEGESPLDEPFVMVPETVEPEARRSGSMALRVGLWAAAVLALMLLSREFWWPEPDLARTGRPEQAAASDEPVPPAPKPADAGASLGDEAEEVVAEALDDGFEVLQDETPVPVEEIEPSQVAQVVKPPVAEPVREKPRPEPAAPVEKPAVQAVKPAPAVKTPEPAPVLAQSTQAVEPEPSPAPARPVVSRLPPAPWEGANQPRGVLRPGPGVTPPVPLDLPRYTYPRAARGSGLQVGVRLALLVDERGRVLDAVVREGADEGLGFNETAIRVAKNTPYQPATRYDIPGKMWTELILEFAE